MKLESKYCYSVLVFTIKSWLKTHSLPGFHPWSDFKEHFQSKGPQSYMWSGSQLPS